MPTLTGATAFRPDFSEYIPFGCLVFEATSDEIDVAPLVWKAPGNVLLSALHEQLQVRKLLEAGWIAAEYSSNLLDSRSVILRVYVLPSDVGHRSVDRSDLRLHSALSVLLENLDVSMKTWQGSSDGSGIAFDQWATQEDRSLFFLFNKIPSPNPNPSVVDGKYSREALEDLLDSSSLLPGFRTTLYPYQRRSAGLMLQREVSAGFELDPRFETRSGPDGNTFYYAPRSFPPLIYRHPKLYEPCRGGILAETMGLGKTCILLALILATKHHPAKAPDDSLPIKRPRVGSLADMAVATVHKHSLPWQIEFERVAYASGDLLESCRARLDAAQPSYQVPQVPRRWNRNTVQPPPKKLLLSATTIIVVPQNLMKQTMLEMKKHLEMDALEVLVMEHLREPLPSAQELRTYDVILFTRNRFEQEERDGTAQDGRRLGTTQRDCRCPYIGATRTRDCTCLRLDDLYHSPLKDVHFKRLIIDEGHFFSNKDSKAAQVANRLLTVDHRWVVSGTPAKDLMGVEVDMSTGNLAETDVMRERALALRSAFDQEDTVGAIKSLGSLATHFLKMRPWFSSDQEKEKVEWVDHIFRHEDMKKRTYTSYSLCLKRTLEAMVVKTQVVDVERDINLPPLHTKIVRLQPSFYDKLTANLFTLVLTANAVTSERQDTDYLFHKNSASARNQLVANLRQSAAIWTGFGEEEVIASIKTSTGYLAKENVNCALSDRTLLESLLQYAELCLSNDGWKGLSRSHELGIFVEHWPEASAEHWSFSPLQKPLLTGISQLLEAQRFINERADQTDPTEGLSGAGIRSLAISRQAAEKTVEVLKNGIPSSTLDGEPDKRPKRTSPKKRITQAPSTQPSPDTTVDSTAENRASPKRKRRWSELQTAMLPADSPLRKSCVVGTTSAKISYLISQIVKFHKEEKILVFFDGENVAYYIAQVLELLNIQHEIYARTLHAKTKSEYVVRFNEEPYIRVLLMDVKQAAFGLNICAASRVFFINPVCQPNVEAQAVKRAHRIGQTRPVYVETLVLSGSLEEKMLERSRAMSRHEHHDAKTIADDNGMRQIIQSASEINISPEERNDNGYLQMAPLDAPQQLFSRQNWQDVLQWGQGKAEFAKASKRRKTTATVNEQSNTDERSPMSPSQLGTTNAEASISNDTRDVAGETATQGGSNMRNRLSHQRHPSRHEVVRSDSTPADQDKTEGDQGVVRRKLQFVNSPGRTELKDYPTPPEEV